MLKSAKNRVKTDEYLYLIISKTDNHWENSLRGQRPPSPGMIAAASRQIPDYAWSGQEGGIKNEYGGGYMRRLL